jgi:hypothetical protein
MYTFLRAIAVKPGANERWQEVDISTDPINILLTKYRQIYVVLKHTAMLDEMTLNLWDIGAEIQVGQGTISDYLSANGNKTLPTVPGTPVIRRNNAVFRDAFRAGYDVQSIDYNVGEGVVLDEEHKPHLVVTGYDDPEGFDYLTFRKKIMANVNGFYHRTAADNKGFYIVEGNKTRLKSNKNYIGLLSFATFGDLEIQEITTDNLTFEKDETTMLVDKVNLKFDNCDLCGKTPILVLGGYMMLIDGENLLLANPEILTFKTRKYPFFERYFESKDYLDFGEFDPKHSADNPEWIRVDAFKNEAFLRQYFTMSQSFLVLVDTKHLVVEKAYPEEQTVPHTFMNYEEPKWPLVVGEGKHEVYWSQYEANSWVMRCHDTYKRNYMFQTVGTSDLVALDNALYLGDAGRYGGGHFLKLIDEEVQILTT